MQKTKLSKKFYLSLVIFSLFGQIAWVVENMYFNVYISKEFSATSFQVALMVSLSAVVATISTLLIGALSDKLGKRKIFICSGYIIWGLSILCFALFTKDTLSKIVQDSLKIGIIGVTLVIIFDCIMTLFGSGANDACFNSWVTDSTDDTNRGGVEGINSMMPLIAILIVFGALASFAQEGKWLIMFIILAALTIFAGILGFFIIEEPKIEKKEDSHYFKDIFYGFKPTSIKKNYKLYLVLLIFAIFGIGVQIYMTFLVAYYEVSLPGKTGPLDTYVLIMAPAIIIAALFTFFYGKLYDRFGFIKTLIPSLLIMSLGLLILFIFDNVGEQIVMKFIGSMLMMSGYLGSTAIIQAGIRDLTPVKNVGLFQGIRIIAQVLIPMLIGPWLGAVALSGDFTYDEKVFAGGYSYPVNSNIFIASLIVIIITIIISILIHFFALKKEIQNVEKTK